MSKEAISSAKNAAELKELWLTKQFNKKLSNKEVGKQLTAAAAIECEEVSIEIAVSDKQKPVLISEDSKAFEALKKRLENAFSSIKDISFKNGSEKAEVPSKTRINISLKS